MLLNAQTAEADGALDRAGAAAGKPSNCERSPVSACLPEAFDILRQSRWTSSTQAFVFFVGPWMVQSEDGWSTPSPRPRRIYALFTARGRAL